MSRTQVMSFEDFCGFSADMIDRKIIKHNDDQVVLCSGNEGTGKSTFSIAYGCETTKKRGYTFNKELIFYEWKDYMMTNLSAMVAQLPQYDQTLVDELLQRYGINIEEIFKKISTYPQVSKGDILLFDEAGTQAFNRDAMSGKNVKMTKLMISNRFLNLMHILNCPKPGSIDRYIKNERTRMLIWCNAEYTDFWEERIRSVHVFMKSTYQRIINSRYWWEYFNDTDRLLRKFPPDITIELPEDLTKFIPNDIHQYYLAKKNVFNIGQVVSMVEDESEDKKVKNKTDYVACMAKDWELPHEWSQRTKMNPTLYTSYGGSKKKARVVREELIQNGEIPEGMIV